jgi:hypothetical protein
VKRSFAKLTFTRFAANVLRLRLTRGQRVLSLIVFDGIEPHQLDGEEREIARTIFGDVDEVPPLARRVLALELGRGSGKTTLTAAYALFVMLTADVSSCGPGDVPIVVVIAPDKPTAGLAVRMGLEMIRGVAALSRCLETETAEGFTLRRPDGRLVGFAAFAASRGGRSARGRTILAFVLDEAQFFLSDDAVVNDRDIHRALIPRLVADGKAIFISTPWPTETLMGELVEKNLGKPTTALACRATSLTMRDNDPELAANIAAERARDPDNAAREFDCERTSGGANFFLGLDDCVDPELVLGRPRPGRDWIVGAGIDSGMIENSSAIAIVGEEPTARDVLSLYALDEIRPERGKPLRPSEVFGRFADTAGSYGVRDVCGDSHYIMSAIEHLESHGLAYTRLPEGRAGKFETYDLLRTLVRERRFRLPRHERLITQLRQVKAKPQPGGGIAIVSPRRAGAHGDLASAVVAGVWRATLDAHDTDPDAGRILIASTSTRADYGHADRRGKWS